MGAAYRSTVISPTAIAAMSPEFTSYPLHLALGVGKHRAIVCRLFDLVGRPRLGEKLLKLVEIVGADRTTLAAQHHKSHGSIELRYLLLGQRARDFLRETKARNTAALAIALFHIVVDLDITVADHDVAGKSLESFAGLARNESLPVHRETRGLEVIH